eukprot:jgi/Tetstr1/440151/TSEL_028508.t1
MYGNDSPTGPNMVEAGKAAVVEGVETSDTAQARIKAGRRSPEFTVMLEPYTDHVCDGNIASATKTSTRQRFGDGPRRNDSDRDGCGGNRDCFKNARPARETAAPQTTFAAKDVTKHSAAFGAFRRVRRTTKTPKYFIADAEAKAQWSELMRGSFEAVYGTDEWGANVLDLLTTSLTATTNSNYEGKIRLFAEF